MPTAPSLPAGREESSRAGGASTQPAVGASVRIPTVEWTSDWLDLVGRAFVAGGALVMAWLGIGLWQTAVLRRRSRPAPRWAREGLTDIVGEGRSAPDLLISGWLAQPVAVGLLRPAIILPDWFVEDEPRCRLEAALAHEWAHFRNRDLWWIAFSGLLLPLLFAHPVYWWLRRRTREDQELLADAAAAQGRVDYAEALLAWAKRTPYPPPLAVAGSLALWERPSQLKRRIIMLLDRDFRVEPTCPRRWGLGVRAGMALAVLALSFMTFRPSVVGADPPGLTAALQSADEPKPGRSATAGDPKPAPFNAATGQAIKTSEQPTAVKHDQGKIPLATSPSRAGSSTWKAGPFRGSRFRSTRPRKAKGGDLTPWMEAVRRGEPPWVAYRHLEDDKEKPSGKAETDAQGRFRIEGLGAEKVVTLSIEGPTVAHTHLEVVTRRVEPFPARGFTNNYGPGTQTIYGADFTFTAAPGRVVEGVVRDAKDKKVMKDVEVWSYSFSGSNFVGIKSLKTRTDAEGRFRLAGFPKGHGNKLLIVPNDDQPYFMQEVADTRPAGDRGHSGRGRPAQGDLDRGQAHG